MDSDAERALAFQYKVEATRDRVLAYLDTFEPDKPDPIQRQRTSESVSTLAPLSIDISIANASFDSEIKGLSFCSSTPSTHSSTATAVFLPPKTPKTPITNFTVISEKPKKLPAGGGISLQIPNTTLLAGAFAQRRRPSGTGRTSLRRPPCAAAAATPDPDPQRKG